MTRVVASFFGTGLILRALRGSDIGSGTVGALFAVPIAVYLGRSHGWAWVAAGAVVLVSAAVWSTGALHDTDGDAGWMVIDEAAGAFVSLIGVTSVPAVAAAFVVFRLADIFKRFFPGVSTSEGLPRGWGVAGDDVVAGLYGLAAGHVVQSLI